MRQNVANSCQSIVYTLNINSSYVTAPRNALVRSSAKYAEESETAETSHYYIRDLILCNKNPSLIALQIFERGRQLSTDRISYQDQLANSAHIYTEISALTYLKYFRIQVLESFKKIPP